MRPAFLFFLLLTAGTQCARAERLQLHSGPARVALVELYTSEGCSSCPPAEQWLGALREAPGLWKEFVPVAFHVDYWNRLGWPDRFSSKANTQREYAYAATWHSESVYTPCFVRDGVEWRPTNATPGTENTKAGILSVEYDGAVLRANFEPEGAKAKGDSAMDSFEIHAALLGGGIQSKVTAGENRGETLPHEFVALDLAEGAPGTAIVLPKRPVAGVSRFALVVWVTRHGELEALQAAGGWIE